MPVSARTLTDLGFSLVESGTIYAPTSIARVIRNLEPTPEKSLRSVRGPARYEPNAGQVTLTDGFGVYHAALDNGMSDMLLVRDGGNIRQHTGWNRTWLTIKTGINSEVRQKFPDQWATVGNRIIWTNGINRALVINSDGYVYPLGFERHPTIPTAMGPVSGDDLDSYPPNWQGYSQVGKVGTVADNYQGQAGVLQNGAWYYYAQYEGIAGDLGPLSPATNGVFLLTQNTRFDNADGRLEDLDDITRAFALKSLSQNIDWVAAIRIYRTRDTVHADATPRLLARFTTHADMWYQDNLPDALLTQREPAKNYIAVPHFKLMCPYQGGLAIANISGHPGRVHLSEAGFAGTFVAERYIDPDPSGAEIYAVATYQGKLMAWTEHSTYVIVEDAEGLRSYPISDTLGCVAPDSVCTLGNGTLIWMSGRGFALYDGKDIEDISLPIWFRYSKLNKARKSRSCHYLSPRTGEYVLAVPHAGSQKNTLHLVYDPDAYAASPGWREQDLNINFNQFAVTRDHRRLILGIGIEASGGSPIEDVFVLDHQDFNYTPIPKTYRWESTELRADPRGMQRFKLTTLYVGFIESVPLNATVTIWKDGRLDDSFTSPLLLVDNDFQSTWSYGTAVLGTDILRPPKLAWRKVEVNCDDLASFRFKVESTEPTYLHLRAFRFDVDLMDRGGSRVPGAT